MSAVDEIARERYKKNFINRKRLANRHVYPLVKNARSGSSIERMLGRPRHLEFEACTVMVALVGKACQKRMSCVHIVQGKVQSAFSSSLRK